MSVKSKLISVSSRGFNSAHRIGLCKAIEPIVVVNEYPKSGGTWLGKMLAATLDLPFIDNSVLPPGCPCVIRNHWSPDKVPKTSIYIVRDYRDVMVSLFHHRYRNYQRLPKLHAYYRKCIGADLDILKIDSQMAGFLKVENSYFGYGTYSGWVEHMRKTIDAVNKDQQSMLVRYEDLVADPGNTIRSIVSNRFGYDIDSHKLNMVVKTFDISVMKKSQNNHSGQTTFVRKGGSGNWRSVFNEDAQVRAEEYARDMLIQLGYEP